MSLGDSEEILNHDTRWGAHTLPGRFSPRHRWLHGIGSNRQSAMSPGSPSPCLPWGICFVTRCITHPLVIFWILLLPSFLCNLFQLKWLGRWKSLPWPRWQLIVSSSMGWKSLLLFPASVEHASLLYFYLPLYICRDFADSLVKANYKNTSSFSGLSTS